MSARLKVYTWAGFVPGGSGKQVRVLVAAPSRKAVVAALRAVRVNNVSEHFLAQYADVTGNQADIAFATAHPGQVVWTDLDRHDRDYHVVEQA